MTKVFTEPKTLREVLTCKSKWYKGAVHHLLFEHLDTINPYNVPLVQRYYSHCLMGAVEWAEAYPSLWGSSNNCMFTDPEAFNQSCSVFDVQVIIDHWEGVANRIENYLAIR